MDIQTKATATIAVSFAVLVLGTILVKKYFSNLSKLLDYLRRNYPEEWEKLGSPTLFGGASPRSIVKVMQLVYVLDSREIEDRELKRLVTETKRSLRMFALYFPVALVVVILMPVVVALTG